MNEEAGRCEKPIVCPCTIRGKMYRLNEIVATGICTKCMCKKYGFDCAPYCPIKSCPKGQVLSYPKGKCCKCVPARKWIPLVWNEIDNTFRCTIFYFLNPSISACEAPKYRLECGCPRTCPALESSTPKCKPNTKDCRKMVCSCPPGKYDDGKSCVDLSLCPCMVDGKIMKVNDYSVSRDTGFSVPVF